MTEPTVTPLGPSLLGPSDDLRQALGEVMRMVVVGSWYDEPEQAGPAVNRLHTAERAMWRLYDLLGVVPGDYARPETHSDRGDDPLTEAGKTLIAALFMYDEDDHPHASDYIKRRIHADILAIEAEARDAARTDSLDVERLARASVNVEEEDERVGVVGRGRKIDRIAAEYAALSKEEK